MITGFVQRSGTRFVVQAADGDPNSCQTFYFAGANAYYIVRHLHSAICETGPEGQEVWPAVQKFLSIPALLLDLLLKSICALL